MGNTSMVAIEALLKIKESELCPVEARLIAKKALVHIWCDYYSQYHRTGVFISATPALPARMIA